MKLCIAALSLLLLVAPAVLGQYQVGDPVDGFTLPDGQGNPVSMSDYPNQIIFLTFWESG
jgi:hypothetical protein